ncbi:MAG: hypothetical protein H6509_09630 [Bryobacterales bacterium]|nr:hypothetical protein [Bryobacterales bacterium]
MKFVLTSALCALLASSVLSATEVAAGPMLGPRVKAERFFVRAGRSTWTETYNGGLYRGKTKGALLLINAVHGLFEDKWLSEAEFDPDANTDALIAALDVYHAYGASGLFVSLQGFPQPYPESSGVKRSGKAEDGRTKGSLVSAFLPNGDLDPGWLARLERLLTAANQRGMVVCLTYFTPVQDEVLESDEALVAGARNMTEWLIEKDFRNVIVNIADNWDAQGQWDHADFVSRNVGNLIIDNRDLFNHAEFTLPIGASSGESLSYPSSLARICDVVLLHGNRADRADKLRAVSSLSEYDRPVILIEDPPDAAPDAEMLARTSSAIEATLAAPGGWALSPGRMAYDFPFAYAPAAAPGEDAPGYFRALLERLASVLLRKPPAHTEHK